MILFTSCEGLSLDRVWQFPADSQQTIIISRKTDVSRGTGMCLNIIYKLYCGYKYTRPYMLNRTWGSKAKEKYRGVFEIQRPGDKTSPGEIGLDIRTHASPKVGQDQVSGGVSVLFWHAAPVAYVLWKPCTIR